MSTVQFISSPNGEEMVLLSRAEYDALVAAAAIDEDAADVAIYDARMADLAAGRDAVLPAEVSKIMLDGNSLLRSLRKWRGLTQADIAARTGLAQGYVSDLEAKRRDGTPETLDKIAAALDVPADWLRRSE